MEVKKKKKKVKIVACTSAHVTDVHVTILQADWVQALEGLFNERVLSIWEYCLRLQSYTFPEHRFALSFHLWPSVKPLQISPQARMLLLLLLFHLLWRKRSLFSCCGPTWGIKKTVSVGSATPRVIAAWGRAVLRGHGTRSEMRFLWWEHLSLDYIHDTAFSKITWRIRTQISLIPVD